MDIDIERRRFKDILKDRKDQYTYLVLFHNSSVRFIEEYIECGKNRGSNHWVAEDQGVKGNSHPIIYKFIDPINGSRKVARLITQEEYDEIILSLNERNIVKAIKKKDQDRG